MRSRRENIVFDIDEVTALIESKEYKCALNIGYFLAVPEGNSATDETDIADMPEDDTDDTVPDE